MGKKKEEKPFNIKEALDRLEGIEQNLRKLEPEKSWPNRPAKPAPTAATMPRGPFSKKKRKVIPKKPETRLMPNVSRRKSTINEKADKMLKDIGD
jgi:hypothetical protein